MRDIQDRRWYRKMKENKKEFSSMTNVPQLSPEVFHVEPPLMEVANEADRALRKMKEFRSRA